MTWCSILVIGLALFLSLASTTLSQVDDLADSPWALPMWDALERYRDDPLCLSCIETYSLTVLPGIDRRTASRIMKLVNNGYHSLEFIVDSLCLSIDQLIILSTCTTFDCSCTPTIQSARWRTRLRTRDATQPDAFSRADVDMGFARIGGFVRRQNDTLLQGVWLQANTHPASVVLGNYILRSSLGLVYGSGTFRRGFVSTESAIVGLRIQPWTSTWTDRALFGTGIFYEDTLFRNPVQLAVAYSSKVINNRKEILIGGSIRNETPIVNFGFNLQHVDYDRSSNSIAMSTFAGLKQTLISVALDKTISNTTVSYEGVIDDVLTMGHGFVVSTLINRTRLSAAARWLGADLRSPYGSPLSTQTAVGNETGITIGAQFNYVKYWRCEAALDIHQTLSRSFAKPQPAKGFDILFDAARGIDKGATLTLRLRYEQDDDGWRLPETNTTKMLTRQRATIRADYSSDISRSLRLRFRVDGRAAQFTLGRPDETGILAFIECVWRPIEPFSIRGRLTTYRSTSIELAPYAVEVETDGTMRTVVGTGIGEHSMLAIRYSVLSMFTINAAYIEIIRNRIVERSGSLQLDVNFSPIKTSRRF